VQEDTGQPANRNLLSIAAGGFLLGVLLHVYIILSVLDGGGDKPVSARPPGAAPPSATASPVATTPARLADRTSCDAIRGTDYRSEAERQWFLANCQ
jgi:hypothetical protein